MDETPPTGSGSRALRVLLVDDHDVVRSGLRAMLQVQPGMVVVAEASTARQAITEADRTDPDVVVMDVRLADGSGIEATREIRARRPRTRVLMLTSFPDEEALFASVMAGASGYVLKRVRGDELVRAVRAVGDGHNLLDPAMSASMLARLHGGQGRPYDEKLARLTPQEERVAILVAEGLTNREIGARLQLSEKTIKNYVSTILEKLEVHRRAEAAAYLARRENRQDS